MIFIIIIGSKIDRLEIKYGYEARKGAVTQVTTNAS